MSIREGLSKRWQCWGQLWEVEGKTAVWRQEYLDWGHTAVRGEGGV